MYVFVYYWSNAISSAHRASGMTGSPPFGLVFASLMCSMTLGSFVFRHRRLLGVLGRKGSSQDVQAALSLAACSLMVAAFALHPFALSWVFCVLEFSFGYYNPAMAFLKASLTKNRRRTEVYARGRIPLNVFVVMNLLTTKEGEYCKNPNTLEGN